MTSSCQADQQALIELEGVTKVYGTGQAAMHALRGIDLCIAEGEFVAVMGPSGSGKSTCMNILGCLDTPTAGIYRFKGIEVNLLTRNQRTKLRRFYLGFVFQGFNLLNRTSALENVELPLIYRGASAQARQVQARQALKTVGLEGWESHVPGELSGGQQQLVALARALVRQPKVLLLDEPLGALDLKLRKAMQLELKQLQHQVGITFVYVTHDQEEALTMSDRIAVIDRGQVLQIGSPYAIYEQPANRFVADFIGETNLIPARLEALGAPVLARIGEGIPVPAERVEQGVGVGERALLSIRPEKVHLQPPATGETPALPNLARLPGRVEQVIYLGTDTRYLVRVAEQVSLVARLQNLNGVEDRFHPGDAVEVIWDAHHARLLKE